MTNFISPFNRYRYVNQNYYTKKQPKNLLTYPTTNSLYGNNYQIADNRTNQKNNTTLKNLKEKSDSDFQNENTSQEEKGNNNNSFESKLLLEIHGIKLYTDDLLILLLIFFLYKENINDKLLLISLFSLLF